jgi:hypothetical protein
MPFNLLLLPLLGGFWYIHFSHRFRFRAQHLDGYRLLLESATAGAILLAISRWLIVTVKGLPSGLALKSAWDREFAAFPYLATALFSAMLGLGFAAADNYAPWSAIRRRRRCAALILRRRLPRSRRPAPVPERQSKQNRDYALSREIQTRGDSLRRLLDTAFRNTEMVSISLENRKWYAGYVAESINLEPREQYFRLLPMLSGYRDKDTLGIRRTVSYVEAYEQGANPAGFHVTIPLGMVRIANLFDENVYQDYFASPADPAANGGNDIY